MTNLAKAMALTLGLCIALAARAEPPAGARLEINHLLGFIEESGCEFNRNGTWHDSKAARAHVRGKYEYLLGQNLINTAEDFIEGAATKSSVLFGEPYTIRCGGDPPLRSSQWLSTELARYRAIQP
jgi:Family of unknown function (DUF5329)